MRRIGFAAPARLIILRHGEKADDWKLCSVGAQRAEALAQNYLGRGAAKSLFEAGEEPAALYASTLHTLELLSPAAATWNKPIVLYSVMPAATKKAFTRTLNRQTREAVQDLLADPALAGKTVVLVWEHHHIANAELEAKFAGEKVTLRQLLSSIACRMCRRRGPMRTSTTSGLWSSRPIQASPRNSRC